MKRTGVTIGELEKRSGFPRSRIHYYLRLGLLPMPYKINKTRACYDESHLRRLRIIHKIQVEYLKSHKTSKVPQDFLHRKIQRGDYFYCKKKKEGVGKNDPPKGKGKTASEKERLYEAVLELYAQRGYSQTRLRDILKKFGMTAPTFYHYFKDKRELFAEVAAYVVKGLTREIESVKEMERDPEKRSVLRFRIFWANYSKIAPILYQLRAQTARGEPWARERLKELSGGLARDIAARAREHIHLGLFRDADPELMAFFTLLLYEGAIHRSLLDRKYSLVQLMVFLGDMLREAFFTEKGKQTFSAFNRFTSKGEYRHEKGDGAYGNVGDDRDLGELRGIS